MKNKYLNSIFYLFLVSFFILAQKQFSFAVELYGPKAFSIGTEANQVAAGYFNDDTDLDLAAISSNRIYILIDNGDETFTQSANYFIRDSITSITTEDFDQDGYSDIAVTHYNGWGSTGTLSVFINDQSGRFVKTDYTTGKSPESVTVGDVDGANGPDIVVANSYDNTVSIFLNDGSGNFPTALTFTTGNYPKSITTGYFDNDSDLDIAVVNYNDNTVSVFIGDGAGGFVNNGDLITGSHPVSVITGDFNQDNTIDLAVANEWDANVSVFTSNGDGTFSTKADHTTGSYPESLVAMDFDGDTFPDLAVANSGSETISLLINDQSGGFNKKDYAIFGKLTTGNFNPDSYPDIAAATGNSIVVLKNRGDGTFVNKFDYTAGDLAASVTADDFNNDSYPDLAVANDGDNSVSVFINKGDGAFDDKKDYTTGNSPKSVTTVDFDKDGSRDDLATANYGSNSVSLLTNNGDGTFSSNTDHALSGGSNPISLAAGNFDQDPAGYIDDIVVANYGSNTISVLTNNEDGTFTETNYATGYSPISVSTGDFDGMNGPDIVVANQFGYSISVFLNDGSGAFDDNDPDADMYDEYFTGDEPVSVATGDFNKDGYQDIATANYSDDTVSVFVNKGDGTFNNRVDYSIASGLFPSYGPVSITIKDIDIDTYPDIVVANSGGNVISILINDGDSNGDSYWDETFTFKGNYATGYSPSAVSSGDFNQDGTTDIATAGDNTVSVFMNILSNLPFIASITPNIGRGGDIITIYGEGFGGYDSGNSIVTFYDGASGISATVDSWSDTIITVTVPEGTLPGPVTVTSLAGTSNGVIFSLPSPVISSIYNNTTGADASGDEGDELIISGEELGTTPGTVTFSGVAGGISVTADFWSDTSITVTVPTGFITGPVSVTAAGGTSNGVIFTGLLPVIYSIEDASGDPSALAGEPVTINGDKFGTTPGTVTFYDGANGISITADSWSDTSITVTVPEGALTGPVTVTNLMGTSNGISFILSPPVIDYIDPTRGNAGISVTIYGEDFGYTQETSYVTFYDGASGININTVDSWSNTSITVTVPTDFKTGPVTVITTGGTSNGVIFSDPSFTGFALDFDGVDDYVEVADSASLDITGAVTMEAWVKLDSYPQRWNLIVMKGNDGGSSNRRAYGMWINDTGDILISYYNGAAYNLNPAGQGFTLGSWHHVVGVIDTDNDYRAIYIDGVLIASDSSAIPALLPDISSLYIGGRGTGNYPLDGLIDNAAIYNRALSAGEIANRFSAGTLIGNESGLAGCWNFNEGSGSTTADCTTNNNQGSIYGASWSTDYTPPSAPDTLSTFNIGNGTSLQLSWSAANDPESGVYYYIVYRDGVDIFLIDSGSGCAHPNPTTTSCIDSGLTLGQTYQYNVSAINGVYGGFSEGPESGQADGTPGVTFWLDFDGVDDYVEVADSASLDITGAVTMEAWVKLDSYPQRWNLIVMKGNDGGSSNGRAYGMWINNTGDILISYYNGAAYNLNPAGQGFTLGSWHHVVGVIDTDNDYRAIYIDGVLAASDSSAIPALLPDISSLYIGGRGAGSYPLDGLIDNAAIYNRALSASEVLGRFNGGELIGNESGLVSCWNFSEGTGSITYDCNTTNANNGTIYGAAWAIIDITAPITTVDPLGGAYSSTQSVTLTADEPATIYYTTDGTTPTTDSSVYSAAITISVDTTLNFFAVDDAGNQETVKTEVYIINDITVPTTTATPPGGAYSSAQSVILTADEPAIIYYTTDGTTPTTGSTVYSGPITISVDTTLKFFAVDVVGNIESVKTEVYIITDTTAPTTTATPPGGTYSDSSDQSVILTADESATIYYTTNGTTPTTGSPVYSGPITISVDTTLKFFAVDNAGNQETVKTEVYIFVDLTTPVTTATPAGGTYGSAQSVTLTADETATIYYTTDGTTPTTSSTVYSGPISILSDTTLKFFAVDNAGNQESVKTEDYTIDTTAPTTTASPAGGTYSSTQSVTLTADEPATIYYTTDGTTPTTGSSLYTTAIPILADTTLKFFAEDAAGNQESVKTEVYTINIANSVLDFDGVDDYVEVADSASLDITGAVTMEAWVKLDSYPQRWNLIVMKGNDGGSSNGRAYGMWINNTGDILISYYNGAAYNLNPAGQGFTLGSWHHVVGVIDTDNDYRAIYIDGVLAASDSSAIPALLPDISSLYIGGRGTDSYPLDGLIDNAAIYNRALSASEVLGRFNGGELIGNESGLVSCWNFSEGSGSTVADCTTNANNGTIYGAIWIQTIIDITTPITTADPLGGAYSSTQSVTLTADEPATIYYTTDGTTPTTGSTVYSGPITISVNTTLGFFAVDNAGNTESVKTEVYTIDTAAPTTTATPPGGTYSDSSAQSVTLTADETATIYYTTDGTTPTTGSTVYSGPITISVDTTLGFFAVDVVGNTESVKTEVYIFADLTAPVTTATPAGGTYGSVQSVILTADEPTTIYYTIDGSTPTTGSTVYSTAIPISTDTTLKFFAEDAAGNTETVKTEVYAIDTTVPATTANPLGGTYSSPQLVTLTADEAVTIYYTTDGTTPTTGSSIYTTAIPILADTTLKFFAEDATGNQESVKTEVYTINITNSVLDFDGVDDYVEVADSASLDITGAVTMEAWVKLDSYPQRWNLIVMKGNDGGSSNGRAYGMWINNTGDILISYYNGAAYNLNPAGQGFTLGSWHHVVGVIDTDNDYRAIYIDGVLAASDSSAIPALLPDISSLYIGGRGTGSYPLDGLIDNAAIYNRALSASEVLGRFNGGELIGNESGLVSCWNFSEGSGSTVADCTTNANNGTIYGATWIQAIIDITAPITTVDPLGGAYSSTQSVTLTADEPATIYYTTDGTTPTTGSAVYSGPITISVDTTLRFFAVDVVGNTEWVKTEVYTIDTTAPTTTATPPGGAYSSAQSVTLTTDEPSTIYYTTDGTTPTTGSAVYSGAITISTDTTLKFFAEDTAGNQESVKTEVYTINDTTVPTTTATPAGGTYGSVQSVTLTADETTTIYYTTNGSTPTTDSAVYSTAITISVDTTLKFFAIDGFGNTESVKTEVYVIDTTAPTTTASPPGGTYGSAQSVTLTADEAAAIYYTTDYSTPTTGSAVYSTAIPILADTTLKFFAEDGVGNTESVKAEVYIIDIPSYALAFNGVDDYVEVPDSASLDITNAVTMEAWVKLDSYPTQWNLIVMKGNAGASSNGRAYGMWIKNTGDILISYYNGAEHYLIPSGQGFTLGSWHHVVGVIDTDNDYRAIYIDGVLVASDTSAIPALLPDNSSLYIGSNAGEAPVDGLIDNAAIYNRALSASEVLDRFSGGELIGNETGLGLVSCWNFNEGTGSQASDCTANNNGGVITGADWTQTEPYFTLNFNGVDDYVEVADSASLDMTGAITIEAWVKLDSYPRPWNLIVMKGNDGGGSNGRAYGMWINDTGDILISYYNGAAYNLNPVGQGFTLGSWHHVVGVIDTDNDYRAIYIDGVLIASDSSAIPALLPDISSLYIGGRGTGSYPLDGLIDNAAIYNRALSASEVLGRFNGGELIGNESGLVSCWNFNEGSGSTLADCTTNNNQGSIFGATWTPGGR